MNAFDLLSFNFNSVTMFGIIIGIILILYFVFRAYTGFINPFNALDKVVLVILVIDILMVWFYSILENILYTLIGQLVFFLSLFLLVMYFIFFYGKSNKVGTKSVKRKSTYKTIRLK